jgi:hypothetical protein
MYMPLQTTWLALMTTNCDGADTQGNWIDCCEFFRCFKAPDDEITVFFYVDGQAICGRISGTHIRIAGDDDYITSSAIPIKIEGNPGVLLQMYQAFGVCPAINEDCRRGIIPQKPDGRRLWCAFRIDGCEPD